MTDNESTPVEYVVETTQVCKCARCDKPVSMTVMACECGETARYFTVTGYNRPLPRMTPGKADDDHR